MLQFYLTRTELTFLSEFKRVVWRVLDRAAKRRACISQAPAKEPISNFVCNKRAFLLTFQKSNYNFRARKFGADDIKQRGQNISTVDPSSPLHSLCAHIGQQAYNCDFCIIYLFLSQKSTARLSQPSATVPVPNPKPCPRPS